MLAGARARLGLRQRFRDPIAVKNEAQLRWWLDRWRPVVDGGGFYPGDALELLGGEQPDPTYWGRRWQQARAEVVRVRREAAIEEPEFFAGKAVVDIGPGPLGFPDACPARVSIGVDPLAGQFAEHGLLLPDSTAVYLNTGAEAIPLLGDSVDVVLARNSLDFVDDPDQVLREAQRILCPTGTLIALFDVDSTPSPAEPHRLTTARVRGTLSRMTVVREHSWSQPFGHDGHRVVVVARKDGGAQ